MKQLSELCDLINDSCDPSSSKESVYVGLEHIDSGAFRLQRHGSPGDVRSTKSRFQKGDVLYGKLRPYLDKGIFAEQAGICSTDILVFRPKPDINSIYLLGLIHSGDFLDYSAATTNGVNHPRTSWASLADFGWDVPDKQTREKIAAVLWKVQRAIETEEKMIRTARELKQSTMRQLFTRGLRNEPQKETEIGLMPDSWTPRRLDDICSVVNSSLSYTDFSNLEDTLSEFPVKAMGVKVSDMNLDGNEIWFTRANIEKYVDLKVAERKLIPPNTVVFPKRGAAIATNKKRLTTTWTVLDPNLIGVLAGKEIKTNFLFYWFQRFDLRTITEPGPTPQLNKKNLTPLLISVPKDEGEQDEISIVLQTIDRKISIHENKRATLQELFKTLLNQLMTGQIRVNDLDIDTSEVIIDEKAIKENAKSIRRSSMEYCPDENEILAALPQVKSAVYIATGGFKHVFRADVGGVDEALKIALLPDDEEDDERIRRTARLEREIDVLSKCTTPSLVKLGSVPPTSMKIADRDYFVYSEEWLPGQPLTDVIKAGHPPTLEEAVSLTTSLMEALGEIDSTDHIHRDVKPANIMATGLTDRPFVLLDLGIAFKVQGTELTGPGMGSAPGTTRYMAPESFSPSYKSSVDIRADIYSAGTTIFEFAAGKHPLVKKYEDVFTTRDRIMNYAPPKLEDCRGDLPEWFCLLVDRTIKKNPSLRFRNPDAVIEEIKKNL